MARLSASSELRLCGFVGLSRQWRAPGWYVLPLSDDPWWIQANPQVSGARSFTSIAIEQTSLGRPMTFTIGQPGRTGRSVEWPGEEGFADRRPGRAMGLCCEERGMAHPVARDPATTAPLSVQAHLYTGDGPPQVADGLGFSPTNGSRVIGSCSATCSPCRATRWKRASTIT